MGGVEVVIDSIYVEDVVAAFLMEIYQGRLIWGSQRTSNKAGCGTDIWGRSVYKLLTIDDGGPGPKRHSNGLSLKVCFVVLESER